jgi:hypothetical protein
MLNVLQLFMQGAAPQVTTLPLWFLRLCHAVSPKTVPMQQGKITYSWSFAVGTAPTTGTPVGPTSFEYVWNPWLPGSAASGTDGFPVCQSPTPYSPTLGAAAWIELTQFMQSKASLGNIHDLVPLATKTGYEQDASAFSVCFANTGGGQNATGGFGTTVSLEVPIFNPIFGSLYTPPYNQPAVANRYPVWDTAFSGDSVWTGGYLSGIGAEDQIGYKRAARFHFVDFNEFFETVSYWIQGLINNYGMDPEFQLNAEGFGPPNLSCPLTQQEVALLLRNVLMQAFKESQPSVQGLYPALPTSQTDPQFVAFLAASNTCFLASTPMQLPEGLVENIRALVMRCSVGSAKDTNNATKQPLWFVPVLGLFNGDSPLDNSYQYYFTLGENTMIGNIYATDSFMYENVKNKDGSSTKKILATDVFGFVDGYDSTQNAYVQINDPMRLNDLCTIWNSWISQWPSTYSSQLTVLGTEGGINVLTSNMMTRYWTLSDVTNRLKKAKQEIK